MVKSTSNKGTKQAIRMLLVVVGIVIGLVALVVIPQVIYNHHEAYKDRPLADGYEYVGRHPITRVTLFIPRLAIVCQ